MDSTEQLVFVEQFPDAGMVTLRRDGSAHVARIELGVVDGQIMTSGGPELIRTRHLRRDSRCTLFVFGPHPQWLGLETRARILDGGQAPQLLMALMRARHGDNAPPGSVLAHDDELERDRLYPEQEYLDLVRAAGRFVITFDVLRGYGYSGG